MVLMMFTLATPIMVSADTRNITIQWYIPSDIGLSFAYPTGKSAVEIRPASRNFSAQGADSQSNGVHAFNITNTGNVNIDLSASFTTDMPTNVSLFNVTYTWGQWTPGATMYWWTDSNDTNSQDIYAGLTPTSAVGYYCNSSGTMVENTTYPFERTFQVVSSAS